jgi:hypothetical protein
MEASMTEIEVATAAETQARAAQRTQAEEWFADGNTWVGLFENKDRGSPNFGARIGLPFDLDAMPIVEVTVGKTRAPQLEKLPNAHKFVLIAICRDADDVVAEMFREDPANDDKPRFH